MSLPFLNPLLAFPLSAVMPFIVEVDVNITAPNGIASNSVSLDADFPMIVESIQVDSSYYTGATVNPFASCALIKITQNTGGNVIFSNQPVANAFYGNARMGGNQNQKAYTLPPRTSLQVEATDLTGAAQTVRVAFVGYKVLDRRLLADQYRPGA